MCITTTHFCPSSRPEICMHLFCITPLLVCVCVCVCAGVEQHLLIVSYLLLVLLATSNDCMYVCGCLC